MSYVTTLIVIELLLFPEHFAKVDKSGFENKLLISILRIIHWKLTSNNTFSNLHIVEHCALKRQYCRHNVG